MNLAGAICKEQCAALAWSLPEARAGVLTSMHLEAIVPAVRVVLLRLSLYNMLARRRLSPARRIRQFDRDGCRTAGFSRLA